MKFTKMHGCGNNYIYVNCFEEKVENPCEVSKYVSDIRFGIGSDGLILIKPSDKADFMMDIYNNDGSQAKMCGNGIRCVGKYVYDHKMTDKTTVAVDTLSGVKYLDLTVKDGLVSSVKVDMGLAITEPAKIPVALDGDEIVARKVSVELDGEVLNPEITCVSMGNPHAIMFVDDAEVAPVHTLGPVMEFSEIFPDRCNIEFCQVISRNEVRMRVWERGSGETWACGTGACATVVACVMNGLTDNVVTVHMNGGDVVIHFDPDTKRVFMDGPAATICEGEIEI